MDNQCIKIKKYMQEHGSITQMEAVREFNCYRLSARIHDMRNHYGLNIEMKREPNKSEFGTHARYFIVKEGEENG